MVQLKSSSAYDFAEITSDSSSGNPRPAEQGQETILTFDDVPVQTSYYGNNKRTTTSIDASTLSQHDRELRSFPLAMASKSFFFVACALFLWLSIDDLYWADEALTIPTSVLQADDDLTWRQYRSRENGREVGDSDASGIGYNRPSSLGNNDEEEDEITWSQLRQKSKENGDDRTRNLRSSIPTRMVWEIQRRQLQNQKRRRQQVSFQTPWDELSFAKQIAAATLGHDAASWNQGLPVFTDTIAWENLSPDQQTAAIELGYDQYLWDTLRGFTSTENDEQQQQQQQQQTTNAVDPATDDVDWGMYYWNELPPDIQKMAAELGYDATLWDEGGRTFADDLFWDELSPDQQYAASVLGYSKETWDVYSTPAEDTGNVDIPPAPAPAPATTPASNPSSSGTTPISNNPVPSAPAPAPLSTSTNSAAGSSSFNSPGEPGPVAPPAQSTEDWRAYDWEDLPIEIKGGAIALGFTETLWNSGAGVSTDQYFWDELSDAQQRAASSIFGYTETTWNASNNKWQKIAWDNLPDDIQGSATTLGYDEELWDSGARLDTDSYSWDELSGEQQQAAYKVFGMSEQSWAGAALKDDEEEGDVKNKGGGRGGGRGGADDDYVFSVGDETNNNDVWVSKYQIIYFVGSICFIVVGVLDLIRELRGYHILMVFAGIFSLLSSIWIESSLSISNIFHAFSMHFMAFQGISALFYRKHLRALLPGPCKNAIWMGDISFICGAIMQSVLSYFYFKDDARENLAIARTDCFAALLFFLTAAVYISVVPVAFIFSTKHKPYL